MNNSNYYNYRANTHANSRPYYNVPLFNDIHTYFPAILYDHGQFTSVGSLLTYIRDQVRYHSNTFDLADRDYLYYNYEVQAQRASAQRPTAAQQPPVQPPVQPPQQPPQQPPARYPTPTTNTFSNYMNWVIPRSVPVFRSQNDQQFLNSLLNIFTQPDVTLMTGIFNLPDPVAITPSNEVLSQASEILTATENHNNVQCMVCLEHLMAGQELRKLIFCRHVFHRQCIDTWFERNIRCPICRHDIRDNIVNEGDEADEDDDLNQID